MRPGTPRSLALAAFLGLLLLSAAPAAAVRLTPVSVEGQPAPGFPAGTVYETIRWFEEDGSEVIRPVPGTIAFQSFDPKTPFFRKERQGNAFERTLVELGMVRSGSREGGSFIVIGRRRAQP
jgi:hypothetical protein